MSLVVPQHICLHIVFLRPKWEVILAVHLCLLVSNCSEFPCGEFVCVTRYLHLFPCHNLFSIPIVEVC